MTGAPMGRGRGEGPDDVSGDDAFGDDAFGDGGAGDGPFDDRPWDSDDAEDDGLGDDVDVIPCPECGRPVADASPHCPACGHWFMDDEEQGTGRRQPAWVFVTALVCLAMAVAWALVG